MNLIPLSIQQPYGANNNERLYALECDDSQGNVLLHNDWGQLTTAGASDLPPSPWTQSSSCDTAGGTGQVRA